jgi:hypothetical protein
MVDSFSSGAVIPVVLTVMNIQAADPKDYIRNLAQSTSLSLYKQTKIVHATSEEGYAAQSVKLAYISIFATRHLGSNAYQLFGTLDAGHDGCELSWSIPGFVEVQVSRYPILKHVY